MNQTGGLPEEPAEGPVVVVGAAALGVVLLVLIGLLLNLVGRLSLLVLLVQGDGQLDLLWERRKFNDSVRNPGSYAYL